ncbi:hypothetical protein D3C75_516560 [compost metagenome]
MPQGNRFVGADDHKGILRAVRPPGKRHFNPLAFARSSLHRHLGNQAGRHIVFRFACFPQLHMEFGSLGRVNQELQPAKPARAYREQQSRIMNQRIHLCTRLLQCGKDKRRRSAHRCLPGQILRIVQGQADDGGILPQHGPMQICQMPFAHLAWRNIQEGSQRCSGAGRFAHDGAGSHYPESAEGHVGSADIPSCKQQVGHVHRIQGTVRDMINAVRMQMLGAALFGVNPLGRVKINGPAAEADPVTKRLLGDNVLLLHHIIPDKAPVLPFARHGAHPLQSHGVRVELPGVFDVIPNAVDYRPQLVADTLVLVHNIQLAAPFDPPVGAAVVAALDNPAQWDVGLGNILGKCWRHILHRLARVLGIEQQCAAQGNAVGNLRRPILAVFTVGLPSDPVFGSGQEAYQSITGAIEKHFAFETDPPLRSHHPACDRTDDPVVRIPIRLYLMHIRIQKEADVRLSPDRLQNGQIPKIRIPLRIAVLVLREQFPHNACFPGIPVGAVSRCSAYPHPHLAAGVAAQHRTVVDKRHLLAQPCCRHCRTTPRQTATDHGNV